MITTDLSLRFVCPLCKGALSARDIKKENSEIIAGEFFCPACRHTYPVVNGIPDFIPDHGMLYQDPIREHWQRMLEATSHIDAAHSIGDEATTLAVHDELYDLFVVKGDVLDVGCSAGQLRHHLRAASSYVGIEPDVTCYDRRERFSKIDHQLGKPFLFIQGVGEMLPFSGGSFDAVIIGFAIEHLFNIHDFFSESYRVLRKGGKLYIGIGYAKPYLTKMSPLGKTVRFFKKNGWGGTAKRIKEKAVRSARRIMIRAADPQKDVTIFTHEQVESGHIYNDLQDADVKKLGSIHGFLLDQVVAVDKKEFSMAYYIFDKA